MHIHRYKTKYHATPVTPEMAQRWITQASSRLFEIYVSAYAYMYVSSYLYICVHEYHATPVTPEMAQR